MDCAAGQKRYFGRLAVPRVDEPGWDMYGEESEALVEGGRKVYRGSALIWQGPWLTGCRISDGGW